MKPLVSAAAIRRANGPADNTAKSVPLQSRLLLLFGHPPDQLPSCWQLMAAWASLSCLLQLVFMLALAQSLLTASCTRSASRRVAMSATANNAKNEQLLRRKSAVAVANALATEGDAAGPDAAEKRSSKEQHMRPIKSLSPSSYSDFQRCPQLFKFRHIDRYAALLRVHINMMRVQCTLS